MTRARSGARDGSPSPPEDTRPPPIPIRQALAEAAAHGWVAGRVEMRAGIRAGKPCVRPTRVPVFALLDLVATGYSLQQAANEYPGITPEDVAAALTFAGRLCEYGIDE